MAEWFSISELAKRGFPEFPTTSQGITQLLKKDGWLDAGHRGTKWRPRKAVGGGREVHISILPAHVRGILSCDNARPAKRAGEVEGRKANLRVEASNIRREAILQKGLAKLAKLDDAARIRAQARLTMLTLYDRFCDHYSGSNIKKTRAAFCDAYNSGQIQADDWLVEALPSVCANSIVNWRRTLNRDGAAALAGARGAHRKGKSVIEQNAEIKALILGMLHQSPHVSAKLIMRALRARHSEEDLPSYRTVQRFLSNWKENNRAAFTAAVNPDAWKNKFMPAFGDASETIERLNQQWEMDSTPGDIILEDGKRYALIGVIDVFSRRLKLHVSPTSRATAIAALTRRAMLDWGVPETVKTDNGSDYTSKHMIAVFEGLDIDQELCPPFEPWHKPHIERAFGTFARDLLELLPGYIGHNVADRKAIEARKSFAERLTQKDKQPIECRMSAVALQEFCDQWCEAIYHQDNHGGLDDRTPYEVAASWNEPVRKILDERALDVLLAEHVGTRQVRKDGLWIDRGNYIAAELGLHMGETVKIRIDATDYGTVYVFDLDGEFICRAQDPARTGISRQEVAAAASAKAKKVYQESRRIGKQLAKEARTEDVVSDILRSRAEEAGKLVILPRPSDSHQTEALIQSGIAARAGETPRASEPTSDQLQKQQELANELRKPAEVVSLAETPRQRFNRALELEERLAAGGQIDPADADWLSSYQTLPEYKAYKSMFEDFGPTFLEA